LLPIRFVHETPFQTTGKPGTATTTQSGILDSLDNPRITLEQDLFGFVPITSGLTKISEINIVGNA